MESEASNCCSGCSRPDLPWSGRGTGLPISGCRFTLYPMTDKFIDIILGSLEKTDTSAVWSETDALSTVYRGKLPYVADAVKALFINAYQEGVHMAIEGQFSKGCPGDISGDSKLEWEGEAPNKSSIQGKHFPVHCKLALYPMGDAEYIDEIAKGLTGSAGMALGAALYKSGVLTGAESDNANKKAFDKQNGFLPFAIHVPDTNIYYRISDFQPSMMSVITGVAFAQAISGDETPEQAAKGAVVAFTNTLADNSNLSNIGNLFGNYDGLGGGL